MEYGHVCISNDKNKVGSWLIRKITRSKWSHAFLTIPEILGQPMAMESIGTGVTISSFDSGYKNNDHKSYRMYRFKRVIEQKDKAIVGLIKKDLQSGYGFLELPWFAWRAICKIFGKDIKHKDNWSQAGVICSELVAEYITNAGYPWLFAAFGKGSINAQDIFETVEANPEIFELVESKE